MAKRVRVSDDAGSNYYTLPGNTAQLNDEVGAIDDTIFGQNYSSNQPGLIAAGFQANAFWKGFAGYVAKIMKAGSPTSMTTEAMTLVSGKTYRVTDLTKSVWNRLVNPTVFDNAVNHTADVDSIDFLNGTVTFDSGYTVTGPVTVTGSYLPVTQIAGANSFTLNQTANTIDETDFISAQGSDGHRSYGYGLKSVSLDLGGFFESSNANRAALLARDEVIIEIDPGGNRKSYARGFFKPSTRNQSGNVGDLEAETITYTLSVPDDEDVALPFAWYHAADTTLNMGVRKALTAWQNATKLLVQYLPDGTNGWEADAVITDLTLSGGLEVMNEFAVSGQFDGELVEVP